MNIKNKKTILIAGGGSGGHLFPAIAIGNCLEKNGYNIKYIGSKFGIESKILPSLNKKYYLLNIKGIHRTISISNIFSNLIFPFRFVLSFFISLFILKRNNPCLVIGTGGYASGMPLLASIMFKFKTLIHEQNSFPGITTKKLSTKVDKVCISNIDSKNYLKGNLILTGLPIREELKTVAKEDACNQLGLNPYLKTVFIVGGSQGSNTFNEYLLKNYNFYIENNIQLIWQCGYKNIAKYKSCINHKNILISGFFENINIPYAASDIIISRSGAVAINEIAFIKKPMILIPLPSSAGNHQYFNAKSFADNGAAVLVEENELRKNIIEDKILELIKNIKKMKMLSDKANTMIKKNALKNIINEVIELDSNNVK
tara:strand:- start:132 stop:1244 length:1113 start_codon:yes stop_codon:yes gene_type:complete